LGLSKKISQFTVGISNGHNISVCCFELFSHHINLSDGGGNTIASKVMDLKNANHILFVDDNTCIFHV
jgi:hypothetical protein